MITSGKELMNYLKKGWTLVKDETGWSVEIDACDLRVDERATEFLFKTGIVVPVASRTVYKLDTSKVF